MSEAASAVRWLLEQGEPEARRVAVREIAKVLLHPINTLYSRLRLARADFLAALLKLGRRKP